MAIWKDMKDVRLPILKFEDTNLSQARLAGVLRVSGAYLSR